MNHKKYNKQKRTKVWSVINSICVWIYTNNARLAQNLKGITGLDDI